MRMDDVPIIDTPEDNEKLDLSFLVAEDKKELEPAMEALLFAYLPIKIVNSSPALVQELVANPDQYNFILTDNDMPDENDGLRAIIELRGLEQFKNLPVILMTGQLSNKGPDFFEKLKQLRIVAVEKPFSLTDEILKEAIAIAV